MWTNKVISLSQCLPCSHKKNYLNCLHKVVRNMATQTRVAFFPEPLSFLSCQVTQSWPVHRKVMNESQTCSGSLPQLSLWDSGQRPQNSTNEFGFQNIRRFGLTCVYSSGNRRAKWRTTVAVARKLSSHILPLLFHFDHKTTILNTQIGMSVRNRHFSLDSPITRQVKTSHPQWFLRFSTVKNISLVSAGSETKFERNF